MAFEMRIGSDSGFHISSSTSFIRAFGWVLFFRTPKSVPLFSERCGGKKHYGIAGYRFRLQRVIHYK